MSDENDRAVNSLRPAIFNVKSASKPPRISVMPRWMTGG